MFKSDIGGRIKELRLEQNLTLSDLSKKTGLSTGYLSQLERGLTTIAIDTLNNLSEVLGVEVSEFIEQEKKSESIVLKSYEREVAQVVSNQFIYYGLSNDIDEKKMLPRMIEILPGNYNEEVTTYKHEGEEFIHILEGVLTLVLDDEELDLYPGDSSHYSSTVNHNWANRTNKKVKMLSVHLPGTLSKKERNR